MKKAKISNKRIKKTLVSPLRPDAFTQEVFYKEIKSKIDFPLPRKIWEDISDGFSFYWNIEVGLGQPFSLYDACNSVDDYLIRCHTLFPFDNLVDVIYIMLNFIDQIPGATEKRE